MRICSHRFGLVKASPVLFSSKIHILESKNPLNRNKKPRFNLKMRRKNRNLNRKLKNQKFSTFHLILNKRCQVLFKSKMEEKMRQRVKNKKKKMIPVKVKEKEAVNKFKKVGKKKMRMIQVNQQLLEAKNASISFALRRKFIRRSDRK